MSKRRAKKLNEMLDSVGTPAPPAFLCATCGQPMPAPAAAETLDAEEPKGPPLAGEGLRIMLVHPGASWSTADVYNGLKTGLQLHGAEVVSYQLDIRIARSAHYLQWVWKKNGGKKNILNATRPTPRDAQYHAGVGALERAMLMEPQWILIVSGMYFDLQVLKYLKKAGHQIAILLTESPYDDEAQAEYIKLADKVWTNERASVAKLREKNPSTEYLAHAWHPLVHIDAPVPDDVPKHDLVFVGTAFDERLELLKAVEYGDLDVGFYGHWARLPSRSKLRPYIRGGVIDNPGAAMLYRNALMNLNFHRSRKGWSTDGPGEVVQAESMNPRCWELAALGAFWVTDPRQEVIDTFGDIVPTFKTADELSYLLKHWVPDVEGRRRVGAACKEIVRRHSWADRTLQILDGLRRHVEERAARETPPPPALDPTIPAAPAATAAL